MIANPILPGCASSHEAQCVKRLTGDIRDGEWLKTLVRDANVTQLVHLAAVLMPFCEQRTVEGACPRCLCEFGSRARTGWLSAAGNVFLIIDYMKTLSTDQVNCR